MTVDADGTGEYVAAFSGMPTDSGNWTMFVIGKFLSYADSLAAAITFMDSDGNPSLIMMVESDTADAIQVQMYNGAVAAVVTLNTGGYTGWWAYAMTHASGSATYKNYFWKEGELGFTAKSDLTNGSQQTPLAYYVVGCSGPFDVSHVRLYKAGHFASEKTQAELDALLRVAAARDGSGDNSWLELASNATATTNEGTAGAFTAGNAMTDSTDQPCLPGHADAWFAAAALQDA